MKNTSPSPVLLSGTDSKKLCSTLHTGAMALSYRALTDRTRERAEADLRSDEIKPGGWCHSQYFTPAVLDAAWIWHFDKSPWALAHVGRQLEKMHRVYADFPESFERIFNVRVASAYFSVAHTALAADLCRSGLKTDFDRYLTLLREQLLKDRKDGPYVFTHFNAGHNAVVTHCIATGIAALALGRESGHPDSECLIEYARDACEMHLKWGFDKQGVPFEGPMYSLVTLDWVYLFTDLLRRNGGEDLFETLRSRFEVIADALVALQLPGWIGYNGYADCRSLITRHPMPWLLLSASALGRPQDRALWDAALPGDHRGSPPGSIPAPSKTENFRGLMDFLWWDNAHSVDPAELKVSTAYVGEGAAVAQYRSSPAPHAVCATILGQGRSHNVPDHTHADAGHFSIYAYGEYLAYDTAYFNFDEDTHSVVFIDGKPHAPATQGNMHHGRFVGHGTHSVLDWVHIDAAAAKGCIWAERTVLFIRGQDDFAYMVVLDNINRDNGVHDFEWQLQANMHTRIDIKNKAAADVIGNCARLECHFFSPEEADYPTSPHRLRIYSDDHPHLHIWKKEPETNPRLVAHQKGPNCNLLSLILPRRTEEPRITVRSAPGLRTFNVYVEHGPWIDQVVYAPDHCFVRLPDLKASAECIVVRRDHKGQILEKWTSVVP